MKIKFLEWTNALFEASFGGGYQRGGNLSHGRDSNRDERKLSKSEEIELAEQSPIFRKHMSPTGWKFVTTVHAAARAFQRRLEFEFQQWREIHDRVAARCDAFNKWKKGDNFVLFYSKSLKQGYVTNVFPDTKTIRIITVLPKEKNLAPPGTAKVLVESAEADFEMYLMEAAEVEAILREEDLTEAATSMEAPDGMTISKYGTGGTVPKVGDWLARSIHYSMLSGAHAYEIVGFSGTSTILAQEHGFEEAGNENTRVLKLDRTKKVGTVVKLRVGKRGDVKIAGGYLDFYTKAEVDAKGIKFSGSRYD